mgnify:CR=1 FL=1
MGEEKNNGRRRKGESVRERERKKRGDEGWRLRVTCMTSTCSFHPAFGSRGLRAQRRLSRKKAIPIFGTKEFFSEGWGISILEYVSGASRMGINWKTSCTRWKIIFMELSG